MTTQISKVCFQMTILSLVVLTGAGAAFGQTIPQPAPTIVVTEPLFLVAILVGIVLAFAFQLILTQFTIAAGISSLGDLTQTGENEGWDLKGIPAKLGIWALLTASVSLFAAAWLAVELSGTGVLLTAAVIGLVIWGLFYMTMTVFETTALSSLVGHIVATASAGFRSVTKVGAGIFSKSEGQKLADTSALVAAAVRDEIMGTPEIRKTQRALKKYFSQAQLPSVDPGKVKKEILNLLEEIEFRAIIEEGQDDTHEKVLVASLQSKTNGGNQAYELVRKAGKAVAEVGQEYSSGKDRPSKIFDSVLELAGKSEEEARTIREEAEEFLRSIEREELQPERIKEELDLLISGPKEGYELLRRRFSQLTPETLGAVISHQTEMSEDEANAVIGAVVQVAKDGLRLGKSRMESTLSGVKAAVREYLDGLGRPELSYDQICNDIEEIIASPKSSPEVLWQRLQALDQGTIAALLASRKDIPEEVARKVLERIEALRTEVARKAEQINAEVARRVEQARLATIEIAERGRKQVALAAWWAFATAAVSAVASVLGALAAIQSV